MRLCKNCSKKIPDSKRSTAEFCSSACKTDHHRKKNGLPEPAFLSFSKPMEITNTQRDALTVTQMNEHKILQVEIGNLQAMFNDALTKYSEYDKVLREYEATGQLPKQYLVFIKKIKKVGPPKTTYPMMPTLVDNEYPDLESIVSYRFGFQEVTINESETSRRRERAIKFYEKKKDYNDKLMSKYNEQLKIYEDEKAAYQEYLENERLVKSDNGYYLGVIQLQQNLKELKSKMDSYTSEIAWRKEIIQDNFSEIIEKEEQEKAQSNQIRKLSGKAIANMSFKSYKFIPEWKELLGEPSKPFIGMIYGDAKAGKSYFAMRLAQYLTTLGDVAYFAVEEGLSATTQQKIKATEADDIILEQAEKIEDIIEALENGGYSFAIIDSVSALDMSAEAFQNLTSKFPNVSFLVILHTTKSNDFAGEKRWKHDVQMILQVTKLGLRTTKIECTGRFGVGEKTIEY